MSGQWILASGRRQVERGLRPGHPQPVGQAYAMPGVDRAPALDHTLKWQAEGGLFGADTAPIEEIMRSA